jgi:ATP-dependent exoDNAse (exonuclease V) beta subunit
MSGAVTTLADAAARDRIRDDLDTTLFVEAAAGTGKTTALVSRILAALRSGRATLDRIVAVTFTEKAAGEMKLRLRSEIERCRADGACPREERARLEQALKHLEIARIGTIHAFCADLLHERPVEAGVDPRFEVAPEDEASRLLARAFDGWFEAVLAAPPPGVRRVLRRRRAGPDAPAPRDALLAAAGRLADHRDFDAAWRREPFDRDAAIDAIVARLEALVPLAERGPRGKDWLAENLRNVARFVADNAHREAVRGRDHDALEAELRELSKRGTGWHWKGSGASYGPELRRADVAAQRDAARAEIETFLDAADADLAALVREELRPVIAAYEEVKKREGKLDFLDLLIKARDLIRGDAVVRAELQQRFTHFFIDEFQDTDPLQVEMLLLLAADDPAERESRHARPVPGKLFLVGDPKQSIYRFRRADVAVYERTKRRLAAAGAQVLELTTSFRGRPEIQRAVNAAFSPVMRERPDGSQARYVALRPFRAERADQPAVVALPVPRPYGSYGKIWNNAIERSLPDAVAAFVEWLVKSSGWTVSERERPGELVPIAPRHVCLLFRRFRSFRDDATRPYVRGLEVRRMPHVLVGGQGFHEREEVLALRNALLAIEWPDDALRVFATLRGPLFALGDDALLAFRHAQGNLHPLRRLGDEARTGLDEESAAVADALEILGRLHAGRNRRPIAETIGRLLAALRAHAGLAIWPSGEQALANCQRLIDRARRFEQRGAPSFRAFVESLEEEAERGEGVEAPLVEEGTEGVRIMTVHKAKGLEFPVVILADPTCRATRRASQHVDAERGLWAEALCGAAPRDLLDHEEIEAGRDAAEAVRLAYVAATRARDLLVVPVIGDPRGGDADREQGWLDDLDPVVYPRFEDRRRAEPAPGCPAMGEDSVRERPEEARTGPGASVRPGAHASEAGTPVVWWDPALLDLDRSETLGLRQSKLLQADEGNARASAGEEAHAAWRDRGAAMRERAARPSIVARPVTALAAERSVGEGGVRMETAASAARGAARPGGARFGALVHAALAAIDGELSAVAAAVRSQARILGATEEEVAAAIESVGAALAHDLLVRARAAHEMRREVPVAHVLADGTIAEGVVDLAFREIGADGAGAWTVVDFKTDREMEGRRAIYEAQVRLYAEAISAATGERTEGVLLLV